MNERLKDKIKDWMWTIGVGCLAAGTILFVIYVLTGLMSKIYELLAGVIK